MLNSFDDIIKVAKQAGNKKIAVAVAQDLDVLLAVTNAIKIGIVNCILVGNKEEILAIATENKLDLSTIEIIDVLDKVEACRQAVQLVSSGKADILMKGLIDTAILMKAVLDENIGLRTGSILSHVGVFYAEPFKKLMYVTDGALNIAPTLDQKKHIIENAVQVAHALGNENPIVAILAAVEKVNPKMQATLDAEQLVKMNKDGIITGCQVGGPYALDNAVSVMAAKHKGMNDPLAGRADILVAPVIEAANMLYKSIVYFALAKNSGVIVGAKAPIVLTSRADSDETKLHSIAVAVVMTISK